MRTTKLRGWRITTPLVVLAFAVMVALTGCTVATPVQVAPFDLHDTVRLGQLGCAELRVVENELGKNRGVTADARANSFKRDWGVDPRNADEFEAAEIRVKGMQTEKRCDATPSPSATPTSASPTATPSATPSATATLSATPSATPSASATTTPSTSTTPGAVPAPADTDVMVPAEDADLHRSEFDAMVVRCGTELDRSSVAKLAKGDRSDFVVKGPGRAVKSLREYECGVMTNPTLGDMLNRGWLPRYGSVNPWMANARDKSRGSLMKAWVLKDSKTNRLFVTEDYQKFAFKLVTLLKRHQNLGVQKGRTADWHMPLHAAKVDGLPKTFRSGKDYRGRFIVLAYTLKGHLCPANAYGINIDDGRLAKLKFACGEPKPPVVKKPPTPKKPPVRRPPHRPPHKPPVKKCPHGGKYPQCSKNPHPRKPPGLEKPKKPKEPPKEEERG